MRDYTAVDLFSGCGGLTLGLKKAGFKVIGAVESEPVAAETYRLNHPEVKIWETDIREVSINSFKRKLGLRKRSLDLLAGCPPCQGFSSLRTLNGSRRINDPRNDLLLEFQRFVEALLPKTIMMENVPGLANDQRFRLFCKRMKELGYKGEFRILNAADYGVPQRRKRLIFMATRMGLTRFAEPNYRKLTVLDVIGQMLPAGSSGDPLHDLPENRTKKTISLIKLIPKNGGSRSDLPMKFQLACHKNFAGFKDVYGRLFWNDVAPTITSGCFNPSKGRFLHPEENRAITLREASILQGFPNKYKFPVNKGKGIIANMIGNAFPPNFASAHAKMIINFLT